MVEILDSIHEYVPTKRTPQEFDIPNEDENDGIEHISVPVDHFYHILLGGDQLTVARIRGAQSIRNNSENGQSCLGGFIPVAEDWHAKMCYLKVSFKYVLYLTDSILSLPFLDSYFIKRHKFNMTYYYMFHIATPIL